MKKIIAIICLLCCILLCACGGEQAEESSSTTEISNFPKDIVLANGKTAAYDIIIPQDCSDELKSTVSGLAQKLQTTTGALFRVTDDTSAVPENKGEIIVGSCSREDTEATLDGIFYRDYKVCVTDKNIVIAAYCDDAAIEGVFRFMSLFKDENLQKDSEKTVLVWREDIVYNHTYSISNANVNGVDIGEYNIVIPAEESDNEAFVTNAEKFQTLIGNYTGRYLEIVDDSTAPVSYEVLIGKTNRAESASSELMKYSTSVINNKIVICAGGSFTVARAIADYESKLIQSGGALEGAVMSKDLVTSYPSKNATSDYRLMQYNVLVEFEGWGSEKSELLDPNVDVRREIVASTVLGYSPDVIVFCELFENWREGLVPMIESEYTGVCLDRTDGNTNPTPIFYKTDRFTLVDSGYTSVTAAAVNRRVVTYAVLRDKVTSEQLIVFGTHLASVAPEGQDRADIQCAEINEMLPTIKSVREKYSGSVIFMGDFNCFNNTKTYNHIQTVTGLSPITEAETLKLSTVDHVFTDSTVIADKIYINFDNYGDYASDHRPVVCDVTINN